MRHFRCFGATDINLNTTYLNDQRKVYGHDIDLHTLIPQLTF